MGPVLLQPLKPPQGTNGGPSEPPLPMRKLRLGEGACPGPPGGDSRAGTVAPSFPPAPSRAGVRSWGEYPGSVGWNPNAQPRMEPRGGGYVDELWALHSSCLQIKHSFIQIKHSFIHALVHRKHTGSQVSAGRTPGLRGPTGRKRGVVAGSGRSVFPGRGAGVVLPHEALEGATCRGPHLSDGATQRGDARRSPAQRCSRPRWVLRTHPQPRPQLPPRLGGKAFGWPPSSRCGHGPGRWQPRSVGGGGEKTGSTSVLLLSATHRPPSHSWALPAHSLHCCFTEGPLQVSSLHLRAL